MGRLVKVCLLCFGAIALVPIAGVAWLYFNSSGLPDTDSLGKFAPATMAQVTDP